MRLRTFFIAVPVVLAIPCGYLACVENTTNNIAQGSDSGASDAASTNPIADAGAAVDSAVPDSGPTTGCPAGCLPPAPKGWIGPSAVYDGPSESAPSTCPSLYNSMEVTAHRALTAPPAQCNCGAPAFSGESCRATVSEWSNAGCASGPSVNLGDLYSVGCSAANTGYVFVGTPVFTPGTCAFPSPTTTLPDAGFSTTDVSCGLPQQNPVCPTDALCVTAPAPSLPYTRLCVHRTGDVPCASADYAERFVAYQGLDDTRACSPCQGTATGGACGGSWGFGGCAGTGAPPPANYPTNSCSSVSYPQTGVNGGAMAPTGMVCNQDGGAPQGSATPSGPVTFCCNQ